MIQVQEQEQDYADFIIELVHKDVKRERLQFVEDKVNSVIKSLEELKSLLISYNMYEMFDANFIKMIDDKFNHIKNIFYTNFVEVK